MQDGSDSSDWKAGRVGWRCRVAAAIVLAPACMLAAVPAAGAGTSSEFIYEWNDTALDVLRLINIRNDPDQFEHIGGDNPPQSGRLLAMLHGASYDAVHGLTGELSTYRMPAAAAGGGASIEAALMEASYTVLDGLFAEGTHLIPADEFGDRLNSARGMISSRWQTQFVELIDRVDAGAMTQTELDLGRAWGAEVGEAMLAWRADDGAAEAAIAWEDSTQLGEYRTDLFTPDADDPAAEPAYGGVAPFALDDVRQFDIEAPLALDSARWQADLDEVRELGRRDRYLTDDLSGEAEEHYRTAFFWAAKGLNPDGSKTATGTVTPAGEWLRIAQSVAQERSLDLEASARLFGLLSLAMHDTTLATWDGKYDHNLWRPIHAIREGLEAGDPDADWLPLIPTSMHPEYPSGHSSISGAAATILADFFGTDAVTFMASGDDAIDGEVREFDSFWAAAEEAAMSRVYGGIHYRFTNDVSLELGRQIAEHVVATHMVPEPGTLGLVAVGAMLMLRRGISRRGRGGRGVWRGVAGDDGVVGGGWVR
ncbi:MAG: vanadium-dependent haloperoxidase [Phycisphaeraceae bacterium]